MLGSNPYASASLYVGDLSPEVTESTLFEVFNTAGPVASVRVCRDNATKTSLGYAYVNFHSVSSAERALETLNFTNIKGRQCRVMWSQRDKQLRESGKGNIFVKNLHDTVDNKTLHETFSVFGSVLSCKLVVNRETGKSRGYGYVHYVNHEDAKKAIEGANGMMIANMLIHAEPFVPRPERINRAPWTNVYIKHIPTKMTEEDLKKFVEEKSGGKINSSHMWEKPMFGKSACVNFENHGSALKCVETLDKYEMKEWTEEKENNGKPLKLYVARSQKRTERDRTLQMNARRNRGRTTSPGNNLYVKPLAPDFTDDKLRELFGPFGNIISAKVMRNPETNQSRGFGFVCFETKEEASQALVKLNGLVIDGTKLYVSRAQKKEERQQFLATRARRTSSRQMYGGPMVSMPPYMPSPQVPPYYNYQRQGMSSQPQMHPAQFAHTLPRPPYGYGQMQPMPLPMQMQSMGVPVNSVGQFGFPMRMQNPGFSGMPPNAAMQPQQPSSAAVTGAVGSATMRSGMGSVGAVSQGIGGARGGQGLSASLGAGASALGGPMSNYSQPTQPVAQAPQQHIFASAGQTGVEPSGQNRLAHSFPSQMSATERETQPLTPQMLNSATAQEKKRMIGERLFPKIQEVEPRLAGKITGMLLEMENTELLILLNNKEQLKKKINEALTVLKEHHKKQSLRNSESQARQRPGSQGNQSASNRQTSASNN